MVNVNNSMTLVGRLVADPFYVPNSDGSKTVFLKLAVRDNFKSKQTDGTLDYGTQFVTVQGFVGAAAKNPAYPDGVYSILEKGMPIGITGHMESYVVRNGAVDRKTGQPCNRWEQCIRIDSVQILESKTEAAARRERQAGKAMAISAAAPVPAVPAAYPPNAGITAKGFAPVGEQRWR